MEKRLMPSFVLSLLGRVFCRIRSLWLAIHGRMVSPKDRVAVTCRAIHYIVVATPDLSALTIWADNRRIGFSHPLPPFRVDCGSRCLACRPPSRPPILGSQGRRLSHPAGVEVSRRHQLRKSLGGSPAFSQASQTSLSPPGLASSSASPAPLGAR